jgi:hypothetical protein
LAHPSICKEVHSSDRRMNEKSARADGPESFYQAAGRTLSMSDSERERLIALKEEHGDKVLWKCWKLFLIRSAGLDGLARPATVFLQEFEP